MKILEIDPPAESAPPQQSAAEARALLDAYLQQATLDLSKCRVDPGSSQAGKQILASSRELQAQVVFQAVARNVMHLDASGWALMALLPVLLRKKLPFSEAMLLQMVRILGQGNRHTWWNLSVGSLVRGIELFVEEHGLSDPLRESLAALRDAFRERGNYADFIKAGKRLDEILDSVNTAPLSVQWQTGEPWTAALREGVQRLDQAGQRAWDALLLHCETARASKPSQKWLNQGRALIQAAGPDRFAEIVAATLAEIGKPGPARRINVALMWALHYDATQVHDEHIDLLRGLVWCTAIAPAKPLIEVVGDAALVCFQKIPNIGPRCPKIGNACLWALSSMNDLSAVAQLTRVKTRAKHVSIRKQLDKAVETAAETTGLSAEDLEEVAVPTCGLTDIGEHRRQLGDFTAKVSVTSGGAELSWIKPDGKTQASVPAAVKSDHAAALKELKGMVKEIDKLLPAQRMRIEQLYLQERCWPLAEFRQRYLDHPLIGPLARRLIWTYADASRSQQGIWRDGQLVDSSGRELLELSPQTRVSLWHPIDSGVEAIAAWRNRLEQEEIVQPFKQAHREVYLLTDAERRTETYSNRFAAHILKQHQFSALSLARGWRYHLQGQWDSHNVPTLEIPQGNLRAEFWVEPIESAEELSPHMIYMYVSTDQVRFYRDGCEPLRLTDVPSLVFSEVMRDVDLFVGVCSVANDPAWGERTDDAHYDYWQQYSFGELSATAQTRQAVLLRLLPKLKIAPRCTITDRFLIVRGDLRTYRIHLGSGNVQMEPNSQYLCIVPARGGPNRGAEHIFLPFDGDHTLSVILSKAFLLAEDAKITDPSIAAQIASRD